MKVLKLTLKHSLNNNGIHNFFNLIILILMKTFYKPSGKVSPVSLVFFVVISLTGIPLLSLLYVVIQEVIPLIYIKFLITAGFGFAISYLIGYCVIHLGRVRSPLVAILYGVGAATIAGYIHWAIWLNWIIAKDELSFQTVFFLMTNPEVMLNYLKAINESGLWSVGKFGRDGALVNGAMLTFVWIVEALIINVLAVIQPLSFAKKPYCESHNKWFIKSELGQFNAVNYPNLLIEKIDAGDVKAFDIITRPVEDLHSIWYLNTCDGDVSYLTILNMIPSYEKNKVQFTEKKVVNNMKINREMKNALEERIIMI